MASIEITIPTRASRLGDQFVSVTGGSSSIKGCVLIEAIASAIITGCDSSAEGRTGGVGQLVEQRRRPAWSSHAISRRSTTGVREMDVMALPR
jgi:hypothetical protein